MRLSHSLAITSDDLGSFVCCAACGHRLGKAGEPWKPMARLRERPLQSLGGVYTCSEQVRIREFSCPGCQKLLDVETALAGDPFLEDAVFAEPRHEG